MNKNLFIFITAFFCGMAVMAVELSASRLLAPYFGTSSIVWTVVIGLIMISLSVGNLLGGRSADKHNSLGRLFFLIWVAAIWIAVIPLVGKYIISFSVILMMWILPNNLIIAGSVFSCLVVFSIPLVFLGMAPPYLVKLGSTDMQTNGRTTGEIYAASTIGSIIGTFIPTFLTIPFIGTQKTFLIFSLVLDLICLYYFISIRKKYLKVIISTILIIVFIIIPLDNSYAFWKKPVLEDESLYNYLQVTEEGNSVILSTNVAFGVQSVYRKDKSLAGLYYDYALMAPYFIKKVNTQSKFKTLILGMGTGTYAKQSKRFFPNNIIDGVEIDKKIIDLSKKYFELKDNEATIYLNDGRTFLASKDAGIYDLVMVDAYHDVTIPFHMATKEFYTEIKKHLAPDGIIMININMRSDKNTQITDYLTQTLKSKMSKVYKFNVPFTSNIIVFSSDNTYCLQTYMNNIKKLAPDNPLKDISVNVLRNLNEVTGSKFVFTDDLAPIEIMGQSILDEIVADSISYFKNQLNPSEKGLWDILKIISTSNQ